MCKICAFSLKKTTKSQMFFSYLEDAGGYIVNWGLENAENPTGKKL